MNPPDHRLRAESIDSQISLLTDPSAIILLCWGAAYHWLAYGCGTQFGQHPPVHAGMSRFLRGQGAGAVADAWTNLENLREAGFYGTKALAGNASAAQQLLGEIRTWALT